LANAILEGGYTIYTMRGVYVHDGNRYKIIIHGWVGGIGRGGGEFAKTLTNNKISSGIAIFFYFSFLEYYYESSTVQQ
jgi:hypothetical protein